VNGGCYNIVMSWGSWDDQKAHCQGLYPGADLAKITSDAENTAVTNLLKSKYSPDDATARAQAKTACNDSGYYIGLVRKVRGQCAWKVQDPSGFEWQSQFSCGGDETYRDWFTGNPNCDGGESCTHIYPGYYWYWNDLMCNRTACAVCEVPLQ